MVCVTRIESRKSDVVRSYTTYAPSEQNYDCQIWEAASATAAAPMYFKHVKLSKGGGEWCDGGLQRNNPINEALPEVSRHPQFETRHVGCALSIGIGIPEVTALSSNLSTFLVQSVEMMTDSEDTVNQFARSKTGKEVLETNRYFRFSVPQGLKQIQLDESRAIESMKAVTTEYLRNIPTCNAVTTCARSLFEPDRDCS